MVTMVLALSLTMAYDKMRARPGSCTMLGGLSQAWQPAGSRTLAERPTAADRSVLRFPASLGSPLGPGVSPLRLASRNLS